MTFDRRMMLTSLVGLASGGALAADTKSTRHGAQPDPLANTSGKAEHIALMVYPGMTILDVIGPYHFLYFMEGAKIHIVTNQPHLDTVVSDAGMGIQPTITMADCPRDLDLLFVPGGTDGTLKAARDPATIAFLRDRGSRARFISSVCTGSLVLGVAGLLEGKPATSHWSVVDCLPQFGATPVHRRVVEAGNVITAAGVSAGLDSGILLIDRMRGRPLAEAAVLATEYAPEPPLPGGRLDTARPQIARSVSADLSGFLKQARTLTIAS